MKRDEFIKIAINDPQRAARILKKNAKQLESCRGITNVAKVLSDTLFVSDRTVFRDCKK